MGYFCAFAHDPISTVMASLSLRSRNQRLSADRAPKVRCREIGPADLAGVAELLASGFPGRSREYWTRALTRLSNRPTPPAFPRYGYLLESEELSVGALLLIYSSIHERGRELVRCNVSSWHVQPAFKAFAPMLVSRALKHPEVTYFNVTPAQHTLPILEAQGYTKYCDGSLLTLPWLSAPLPKASVEQVAPGMLTGLPVEEEELLLRHASYGCMSLCCGADDGVFPFVFAACRASARRGFAPYARLIYCRALADFARFARPLGVFLARRGLPMVLLDSNGSIPRLRGIYFRNRPKYFKGPRRPRLGDLADSELALFEGDVGGSSRRLFAS